MIFSKPVINLLFISAFALFLCKNVKSQDQGHFSGNFNADMQYLMEDESIGAFAVREKMLLNSYANFTYTKNNFSAGIRYEGYMNTMLGFPNVGGINDGVGIPYRWASFRLDNIDFTVGNFYEQFGSGLVLRTYEEKMLGIDNSLDGIRINYNPYQGIFITALAGQQRFYWEKCEGIVRAINTDININELISTFNQSQLRVRAGGSFVSKFQPDNNPIYKLPENVAASAARLNLSYKGFSLMSEYAYKIGDPSADNNFIYKSGEALLINTTYSGNGIGILLETKWVDNMSFRSNRNASLTDLNINQMPEITRTHTYSLSGFYPYATQNNGEWGIQGEIMYRIDRNTKLGGPYGTTVSLNYSRVNSIEKKPINDTTPIGSSGTYGYKSSLFNIGDELFFQDINIEINRRWNRKLSSNFLFMNVFYNYDVIRGVKDYENVSANIAVADFTYRITRGVALKTEMQKMWTNQDMGDWAMLLFELSIPNWFINISDNWNYGNPNENMRTHYMNFGVGHNNGPTRIFISYGKYREGVVCIGGVCRIVPPSNGFMLSISSTF